MSDGLIPSSGDNQPISMPSYNLGMCTSKEEAGQWKTAASTFRNYATWTKTKFESLTSISRSFRDMSAYRNAFLKSKNRDEVAVQKSQMSLEASKQKYANALNEARQKYASGGGIKLPF